MLREEHEGQHPWLVPSSLWCCQAPSRLHGPLCPGIGLVLAGTVTNLALRLLAGAREAACREDRAPEGGHQRPTGLHTALAQGAEGEGAAGAAPGPGRSEKRLAFRCLASNT